MHRQIDEVLTAIPKIGLECSQTQSDLFRLVENDDHREAAVQALVALNAEGFPTLRRGLNHPRPEIREAVALAALELGSDAETLLPEFLSSESYLSVREAAATAIAEIQSQSKPGP